MKATRLDPKNNREKAPFDVKIRFTVSNHTRLHSDIVPMTPNAACVHGCAIKYLSNVRLGTLPLQVSGNYIKRPCTRSTS